jgi:hypothetical protein
MTSASDARDWDMPSILTTHESPASAMLVTGIPESRIRVAGRPRVSTHDQSEFAFTLSGSRKALALSSVLESALLWG